MTPTVLIPRDRTLAQGAQSAIRTFAKLKNVSVEPEVYEVLAENTLQSCLGPADRARLSRRKAAGLAALTREVNAILDRHAVLAISSRLYELESFKDASPWLVLTVVEDIARIIKIETAGASCIRWPDVNAAVEGYFSKPRGPLVTSFPNGDVLTSYWLGGNLHRDPKDGPAWHLIGQWGERIEYLVNGKWHRDAEDGPAVIDTDFKGRGIRAAEYYKDGEPHRPWEDGPAAVHTDADGNIIFESYAELGIIHRDNREGPAQRRVDGDIETLQYLICGIRHRDDGPAVVVRNRRTGIVLREEYFYLGKEHRTDGPAMICRNEDGSLDCESWYRDGLLHRDSAPAHHAYHSDGSLLAEVWWKYGVMHRDPRDGPALTHWDRNGTVSWRKYCLDGEKFQHDDTVDDDDAS